MLRQVERSTGKRPAELDGPEIPDATRHLWSWFLELHAGRGSSGYGLSAISYGEMDAWSRLRQIPLESWEVQALRTLDALYLQSIVR